MTMAARDIDLSVVNVVAELEAAGIAWEPTGDQEVKVRCPAHEDQHASCSINVERRMFKCHAAGCGVQGDFITFLGIASKTSRAAIVQLLVERYGSGGVGGVVDPEAVERWHADVWSAGPLLAALRSRGLSDDTIRRRRIGFNRRDGRIAIPVYSDSGACVNVRRYLPGAPGNEKMKNMRGHGRVRLYPLDQLEFDTIIVCGGEMKALVAAQHLNQHGIGAITATAGEGNWERSFSEQLRGKKLFTCMDVDPEGKKAADLVCAQLKNEAAWVGRVDLPLDTSLHPHGDLNDYFGVEKRTAEEFLELMRSTPEWTPADGTTDTELLTPTVGDSKHVHLSEASQPCHVGVKLTVKAVVTGKDQTPYLVPRVVLCDCDREQDNCGECPVYATKGEEHGGTIMTVDMDKPASVAAMLGAIGAVKKQLHQSMREMLRIPPCKSVQFRPREMMSVEDLRLSPQLEITSRQADSVVVPAYYVGHGIETNSGYQMEGRTYAHPRDQHAVYVATSAKPSEDSLSSFKPSDEELAALTLFQPDDWTVASVTDRLAAVYDDLSTNVTRIFKRQEMHLTIDLAYHSPLFVPFDGRTTKGWVEVLIVGDSGQGKTETAVSLQRHYGLGARVDAKSASEAGMLGGLKQEGSRWFVTWGVFPKQDRRLVLLEELKGAPPTVLARLTDMRSSGVAQIEKIEGAQTHARTRFIAVTNPKGSRTLSQYAFGVESVRELIEGLEDIRRFDMALLVSSAQVKPEELNALMKSRPDVPHVHTSQLCQRLVLWAWTRQPDQVTFEPGAQQLAVDAATDMSCRYTDAIPLVDRGSMRLKIARLAASLACRTFSCSDDMQSVVVRACHVQYVVAFLEREYSSPISGYAEMSENVRSMQEMKVPEEVFSRLSKVPHVGDVVESMLNAQQMDTDDVQDWCDWDHDEARSLLSYLVRKHALFRDGRTYRKTAAFIELLRKAKAEPELMGRYRRPDYVPPADSTTPRNL